LRHNAPLNLSVSLLKQKLIEFYKLNRSLELSKYRIQSPK